MPCIGIMIATLSQSPSTSNMGHCAVFTRNSNSAGAPLPLIPRRASSSRVPSSAPTSSFVHTPLTTVTSQSHPERVSYDHSSSDSSSSDNYLSIRPKRVRGTRLLSENSQLGPCPPISSRDGDNAEVRRHSSPDVIPLPRIEDSAASSPTVSTPSPKIYQPGCLKLSLESLKPRTLSEPDMVTFGRQASRSAPLQSIPPLIRKKSGEPLRSSLKGSKARVRGSLSVLTDGMSSKSAPATPSATKVQFDSHLEHVKLFFAEQKPIAVSRDGSPTDTSGTDSDFPSWIYADSHLRPKKSLVMRLLNKPITTPTGNDVVLEDMALGPEGKSIVGHIRVRNIGFQKSIAVRFTFDTWQTTSEVSGQYEGSPTPQFDRFSFYIKLNDIMARIEGKSLELAVKYTAAGRELWDNNFGRNYIATFTKRKVAPPRPQSDDDLDSPITPSMGDLRSRLEKVVRQKDAPSLSSLSTSSSLKSRYSFGASLKNSWKSPDAISQTGSSIPFPTSNSPLASPSLPKRKSQLSSPHAFPDVSPDAHRSFSESHNAGRNHQRGYFDLKVMDSSSVRRTPPGVLDETPPPSPRHHSFPPLGRETHSPIVGSGDFPLGITPRLVRTESGSSTGSSSFLSTPSVQSPAPGSPIDPTFSREGGSDYKQFINKFCFFTGALSPEGGDSTPIPRCTSISSLEELLSSSRSDVVSRDTFDQAPHRSPSLDSISPQLLSSGYRSGTTTPRAVIRSPLSASPMYSMPSAIMAAS